MRIWALALTTGLAMVGPTAARAADVRPMTGASVVVGTVDTIAAVGDRVFLGGSFHYLGPPTGPAVAVDFTSGRRTGFPQVDGGSALPPSVSAAVPDGRGGSYLGGAFARVGGEARVRLVHVLADGSIDPVFVATLGGELTAVSSLALVGDRLFVAGSIDRSRANPSFVALDARTGLEDAGYPSPELTARVLLGAGDRLYIGGRSSRGAALVALDAGTGRAATKFRARVADVTALAAAPERLYVGGDFRHVGGAARNHLVALDPRTGAVDGRFAPRLQGPEGDTSLEVLALALDGPRLFVGGKLQGAGSIRRSGLVVLDGASGEADRSFDAGLSGPFEGGEPQIRTVVPRLDRVYVGGAFRTSADGRRNYAAAFDSGSGSLDRSFAPAVTGPVSAIVPTVTGLVLGGAFESVDGLLRPKLAAVEASTGRVDPEFDARFPNRGTVLALTQRGSRLLVGGRFDAVAGVRRRNLAAVDATTGTLDRAFSPQPDEEVLALTQTATRIYAGGAFFAIGGGSRERLAALDPLTGALDRRFRPGINDHVLRLGATGRVFALATGGGRVFAGGAFERAGGERHVALAALDGTTGRAIRGWRADVAGHVESLLLRGPRLYVGGPFTSGGAVRRRHLEAVESRTGRVEQTFTPRPVDEDLWPVGLAATKTRLYTVDRFATYVYDLRTGAYRRQLYRPRESARAIAVAGGHLFVGGDRLTVYAGTP